MIERVFGVSLMGLSRGIQDLESTAERIARPSSSLPAFDSTPTEPVPGDPPLDGGEGAIPDFVGDTVSLLLAQRYIEFQLGVIRTADEIAEETVNLKG